MSAKAGAVTLRPATAEDVAALSAGFPWRVRAIAGVVDDKVIAIGGLVFRPDGAWATVLLTQEARRYKVAMHRAALMTLAMARELGVAELYARAEPGRAGAQAWLERLGFAATPIADVFVWRP